MLPKTLHDTFRIMSNIILVKILSSILASKDFDLFFNIYYVFRKNSIFV